MDASSDSGSEEFDQQELEVALYSQIHFDAGSNNEALLGKQESQYHNVTQPFRVRVKELPKRTTQIIRKQPVLGGDFLAFSETTSENCIPTSDKEIVGAKDNNDRTSSKANEVNIRNREQRIGYEIDRCPDQQGSKKSVSDICSKEKTFTNEPSAVTQISQQHRERQFKKAKRRIDKDKQDEEFDPGTSAGECNKVHIPENFNCDLAVKVDKCVSSNLNSEVNSKVDSQTVSKKSTEKKKTNEKQLKKEKVLLPFKITKATRGLKKTDAKITSINSGITEQVSQEVETKKQAKLCEKNLPKLEEFLELPKSESTIKFKKKAPLRKEDVAVQPRRPPVRLRRPPAVFVRYQQDSDTNTDYSDSETSSNPSPMKADGKTAASTSASQPSIPPLALNNVNAANEGKEKQDIATKKTSKAVEENVPIQENLQDKAEVEEDSSGSSDDDDDTASENVDEEGDSSESDRDDQEEQSGSESENTDSSSPVDFLSETNPDLEFNLEGGVDALLRVKKSPGDDLWKIDEKDLYSMNSIHSRYFSPRKIQCRNCKGEGHMSRDCPKPMKRPCIFCGIAGHVYQACPNAICYNCDAPGHKTADCSQPKRNWRMNCDRCWMQGHEEKMCPDRWRQYHLTVNSRGSHIQTGDKGEKNPQVFCYNCGKKGHLGYECRVARMNHFTVANYPFIARYDTKRKRQEMTQAREDTGRSKKKRKHGERRMHQGHKGSKDFKREEKNSRYAAVSEREERGNSGKSAHSSDRSNSRDRSRGRKDDYKNRGRGESPNESKKKKKKRKKDKNEERQSKDRKDDLLGIPGTSGRNRNSTATGRGWKREYEEGEIDDDDVLDDFEGHQANDNEWWNRRDRPPKKKRKRSGKQSGDNWRGDKGSEFQDDPQSHRERHVNEDRWKRGRGRGRQAQGQHRQRHPSPPPKFNERQMMSHYQSSDNLQFNRNWNYEVAQSRGRGSGRGQRGGQGHLKHSESWPMLRNQGAGRGFNRNGFRAQNDRFVSMKNSCDITINLRK